jgi:uncharacterized membrane protein YdjX (TVP38/TMEM64 family)
MSRPLRVALALGIIAGVVCLGYFAWPWLSSKSAMWSRLIDSPQHLRGYLLDKGTLGAPLVFIGIQVAQVILAPIPGEAGGILGGYLFGTWPGFFYSSVGLTLGSLANFAIGRGLGRRFVTRFVPARYVHRLDAVAGHQGVLFFLLCFLFPGFPKDYLCLFIGLTPLPVGVFVLLAGLGRMPGTLMLSLQGAQVLEKDYVTLVILVGISLAVVVPVYVWRHRVYAWADKKRPRKIES